MAALASSFLDEFTSTLPKDEEEDFAVSTESKKNVEDTSAVKQEDTSFVESTEEAPSTDTQAFLQSFAGSGTSDKAAVIPEDTVEEGSPISTAQSALDRLLSRIKSEGEAAKQSVVFDLKAAGSKLAKDTEEYDELQQTINQYLGGSLEDIAGGGAGTSSAVSSSFLTEADGSGGLQSVSGGGTTGAAPAVSGTAAPSTTFLDTYISQVSSAASAGAQVKLGGLLGKPVVASSPQQSIVDTFKQNLGNAQARTAALAQQAGTSALANTSKYTQPVNSSAIQGTYTPTQPVTATKPTGFTGSASNTSAAPSQSSPTPPDISMLGQKAQKNLENVTGITAQKEAVNTQLGSFGKSVSDYSSAANAQKTLENNDNISSSFNSTLDNIARSLPPEQQSNFFNELGKQLTQNISDKAENLAQLTQLGTPAQNFLKHILGYDQPQTEQNTPPDLTNKIRNYVLNDPKVQALEPGQAVNVDLEFTPGAELAAGFTFGKGVVYKDPNTGSLHFTESIDAQGKNTNQNANRQGVGTWSGNDGAYFFNKFTDPVTGQQTYDVDAAGGGPVAKFLLENAPNKAPFNVNLDLSDPSKFGAQKSYGLDDLKGIFEKALDRAKNEFDNFKEGATGAIEGANEATSEAQRILQEYLGKIQNPWQEDPDISSKEWQLRGMWSGKPRYLSTEEVMKSAEYAYGSHGLESIKKAMSEFPNWRPEGIMGYVADGKRPPFPFSMPVKSKFARQLDKIRDGGTLTAGPVWFESYLSRNEKLKGINSKNEAEFEAEKKAIAQRNALGDLFQGFLNMVQNAVKQVDWNSALSNFARSAGRIVAPY